MPTTMSEVADTLARLDAGQLNAVIGAVPEPVVALDRGMQVVAMNPPARALERAAAALAARIGAGGWAWGFLSLGRVGRFISTYPLIQTAHFFVGATPVSRLAEHPSIRIAHGEGTFARLDAHCGKSFGLEGLPYRRGGWTATQLRGQPDTVRVAMILVVGRCDHR